MGDPGGRAAAPPVGPRNAGLPSSLCQPVGGDQREGGGQAPKEAWPLPGTNHCATAPGEGAGDTVRLGSTSSPLCRTPGGEEGHRGHSHICHPRTARGGGPQTRLHVRVTWRTWSKCRCPGHTPGRIIRTSVGWGTGVSSFKIISKLAFSRPGGNRKTSFSGEHKEVSGKQA